MSIKSVMPSSHLILCRPLLLLPPIPPSIRVFSNESALRMRWSKYCSFSFSVSPSNEHPGLISFRMDWLDLLAVQGTLKSLRQHQFKSINFFGAQLSSQSNSLMTLLAIYFIIMEMMLDKRQIWAIFLPVFKMGFNTVEITFNINNTFGPGTAKQHTVQWWFKKFCKGDENLEDEEHSGWPL